MTHLVQEKNQLIEISADDPDLNRATVEALAALQASNNPPRLFLRGGPVRLEHDQEGKPILQGLTIDRMRYELTKSAEWYKTAKSTNGEIVKIASAAPIDVVHNVLACPDLGLPALTRIVEAPVFALDGSLQDRPGYNPKSGTYYAPDPDFVLPEVPRNPTRDDLIEARSWIDCELFGDFPFKLNSERTNAVALYLSFYVREMILGPTPLHLIDKPCQGTGASLFADAISYPAIGRSISAITEGGNDEEWRKRITAKLLLGSSHFLIDNVRRPLESASLSSALTAITWEDRRLQQSEMVRIPVRCVWIATGNNCRFSTEVIRRIVRIRLDAGMDQPWLRKGFKHPNLRAWMRQERGKLVWSALVLARYWISQGKPKPPVTMPRLGSFEEYSEVIGGILTTAGYEGFLDNLQELYAESDPQGTAFREFISSWHKKFRSRDVGVPELFPLAKGLDLGEGSDQSQHTRLGHMIKEARDCRYGDLKVEVRKLLHGHQQYRVVKG